jgi:hypothetical protein
MRIALFIIVTAACLLGCSPRDPIDRLMTKLSNQDVPSYPFKPIELSETATPDQLVSALSKRSVLELGHLDFTTYKILNIRLVHDVFKKNYTAVLLDTNLGQKIVLFQALNFKGGWPGWYYRIYDAK